MSTSKSILLMIISIFVILLIRGRKAVNMEHIGEIIKQRRKKLGLTQDQLARKLGYTDRSTISRIESGNNDVSTAQLYKFAEALHTTPAVLLGIENGGYYFDDETATIAQLIADNEELHLLFDDIRGADPESLKLIHEMLIVLKRKERLK